MSINHSVIREAQIVRLFQSSPLTLAGSTALGVITWLMLTDYPVADVFGITLFLLVSCRAVLYLAWRRSDNQGGIHWGQLESGAGFLVALTWTYLNYHVFQLDDAFTVANTAMLLVGFIAGSIISQSVYLPAFLCFAVPAASFSSLLIIWSDPTRLTLGLFGFCYAALSIWFAYRMNAGERERIEQSLELAEATKAKSQFFAAASHDLRQPIHALSLYLGAMQPTPAQQPIFAKMESAITGLQALYDRVLDISRLEAGTVQVTKTTFQMTDLIAEVVNRTRPLAEDKSLQLLSDGEDCTVTTDKMLLGRILDNIVGNAIKYTDTGSVRIQTRDTGTATEITITDTGVGIADQDINSVFDPYVQVDHDRPGLGLGLSIVRSLSSLLEIDVSVQSSVTRSGATRSGATRSGKTGPTQTGTVFTLSLPTTTAAVTAVRHAESAPNLQALRIIVLDDDEEVRAASVALINNWGYESVAPASWSEFESLSFKADVLMTDYHLWQDKSGFDAIALWQGQYAILVTAETSAQIRQMARQANVPLLNKPIKPAQLRLALQRYLADNSDNC